MSASSKRRALHRIYVGLLADLVLKPADGTPPDASMLARMHLEAIREQAEELGDDDSFVASLDGYGAGHLNDLDQRIDDVLDADITIPADAR